MRLISPEINSGETSFTFFAGTPAYILPAFTLVFLVTTAPAAIILLLYTIQSSIIILPMPTSTLSCIVQPWTIALCPIDTLLPIFVGEV